MTNPNHTDTRRSGDLVERFNRFLSEWGKSRQYGDVIYGLHVGTDREVELTATSIREAADRIEALEAEVERLRDVIDVIWVEASTMRNARKLIGPYPTQPEKNRIWARSVCHIGKRLMEIIQPIRAKLGEKQ